MDRKDEYAVAGRLVEIREALPLSGRAMGRVAYRALHPGEPDSNQKEHELTWHMWEKKGLAPENRGRIETVLRYLAASLELPEGATAEALGEKLITFVLEGKGKCPLKKGELRFKLEASPERKRGRPAKSESDRRPVVTVVPAQPVASEADILVDRLAPTAYRITRQAAESGSPLAPEVLSLLQALVEYKLMHGTTIREATKLVTALAVAVGLSLFGMSTAWANSVNTGPAVITPSGFEPEQREPKSLVLSLANIEAAFGCERQLRRYLRYLVGLVFERLSRRYHTTPRGAIISIDDIQNVLAGVAFRPSAQQLVGN